MGGHRSCALHARRCRPHGAVDRSERAAPPPSGGSWPPLPLPPMAASPTGGMRSPPSRDASFLPAGQPCRPRGTTSRLAGAPTGGLSVSAHHCRSAAPRLAVGLETGRGIRRVAPALLPPPARRSVCTFASEPLSLPTAVQWIHTSGAGVQQSGSHPSSTSPLKVASTSSMTPSRRHPFQARRQLGCQPDPDGALLPPDRLRPAPPAGPHLLLQQLRHAPGGPQARHPPRCQRR
jgi:hypothetical protein